MRLELEGGCISPARVTQEILHIMQVILRFDRFIHICPNMETAIQATFSNQKIPRGQLVSQTDIHIQLIGPDSEVIAAVYECLMNYRQLAFEIQRAVDTP